MALKAIATALGEVEVDDEGEVTLKQDQTVELSPLLIDPARDLAISLVKVAKTLLLSLAETEPIIQMTRTGAGPTTLSTQQIAEIIDDTTKSKAQRTLALIPVDATTIDVKNVPVLDLDFTDGTWSSLTDLTIKGKKTALSIPNLQMSQTKFPLLQNVVFPDGLETIGSWFNGNKIIKTVSAKKVKTLEESAFDGCTSLVSLDTPAVTRIKKRAMYGCDKLTSLPSTVIEVVEESGCLGCSMIQGPATLTALRELHSNALAGLGSNTIDRGQNEVTKKPISIRTTGQLRLGTSSMSSNQTITTISVRSLANLEGDEASPGDLKYAEQMTTLEADLGQVKNIPHNFLLQHWRLQTVRTAPLRTDLDNVIYLPQAEQCGDYAFCWTQRFVVPTSVSLWCPKLQILPGSVMDESKLIVAWVPSANSVKSGAFGSNPRIQVLAIGKVDATSAGYVKDAANAGITHLVLPSDGNWTGTTAITDKTWMGKTWRSITSTHTQQQLIDFTWNDIAHLHESLGITPDYGTEPEDEDDA